MKVFLIAGARPNFMKIAPIWKEIKKHPAEFEALIVHTGQHYDYEMSKSFFEQLVLPEPDFYLGVGSASQAYQTAKIMVEFEKMAIEDRPDLIVVVGDVNSTLACSLVAAKLQIKLAHIEAGLRSFDRSMPEEINRIVTDVLSDYLFTTCQDANNNLKKEGIGKEKTFFVGNVMIDSLFSNMEGVNNSPILERLGLEEKIYALLTLHRPSNVDQKETFLRILEAIEEIQKKIKIVFSVHPRTRIRIKELGLDEKINSLSNMIVVEPLSYLDFLRLTKGSKFTMTDSGGLQEETTVLGIPCVTIRENTERPITISEGTNVLVGTDTEKIVRECLVAINGGGKRGRIPKLWDGKAAKRIVEKLLEVDSLAGC